MKKFTRLVSVFVAVLLLCSCVCILPASSASSPTEDVRFTKKIVSVLFDNSGSMKNQSRNEYALYALQMLMSLLNSGDSLVITPMNIDGKAVSNTSAGIEIDLAASDRNLQITTALKNSFLKEEPFGGTPSSSISVAIDQLEAKGLKDRDNLALSAKGEEHWLVILTDGAFEIAADQAIESYISDFPSLKTVFIGFGSEAPDLSGSALASKYPFTPYTAANTAEIVSTMQKVANQLSGRYTLDPSDYSVNGTTVTVDLDSCEFSLKNISIIAQNCNATLRSVSYNGTDIPISHPCTISPDRDLGMKNGYSALANGDPYLSGGKMTFTFSGEVSPEYLSIFAEPALNITSYLEYHNGTDWERTTMQYINANLSGGDKVRVGYSVFEQAGGKEIDISKIFGDVSENVTYAGSSYAIGEQIPLVVGNNEISVAISVMDGAYSLYDSIMCIIEENPTFYRVEGSHPNEFANTNKVDAAYTVYVNNKAASAEVLKDYVCTVKATLPDGSDARVEYNVGSDGKINASIFATDNIYGKYTVTCTVTSSYGISREYTHVLDNTPEMMEIKATYPEALPTGATKAECEYKVLINDVQLTDAEINAYDWSLTVTAPDGSEVTPSLSVTGDGRIVTSIDVNSFGAYSVRIVFKIAEGLELEYEHSINNYPSAVVITPTQNTDFSLSEYQLSQNANPIVYELLADGNPLSWDNAMINYRVLVGSTDVTQYTTFDSNKLSFVPTTECFPAGVPFGENTVTVEVKCPSMPSLDTSATTKLSFTNTVYSIESVDIAPKNVDRFRLGNTEAALYFKVTRDGVPLSADELQSALDSGEISLSDKKGSFTWQFWLPVGRDITVETVDSSSYVVFRAKRDVFAPLDNFMAMFIFNGDKPIEIIYHGASLTDAITFDPSPVWSYIWRVLVIILIIHTILYIIGFFNGKCKSLPAGVFVTASPSQYDGMDEDFSVIKFNTTFRERYLWHLYRFIPHSKKLWYHQPTKKVPGTDILFGFTNNGKEAFFFRADDYYPVEFEGNGSAASDMYETYYSRLSKYPGKGVLPQLERSLKAREMRSIFRRDASADLVQSNKPVSAQRYYGTFDGGKLTLVVKFIRRTKTVRRR